MAAMVRYRKRFAHMPSIPAYLRKALAANPVVAAKWKDLTPVSRRDFTRWIEGAKQEATRKRRVAVACEKLKRGDRRPCCYAVVPMPLYRALGTNPKAKAEWSALTADQKRDMVDWVESPKPPETQADRIKKAVAQLAAGKFRA